MHRVTPDLVFRGVDGVISISFCGFYQHRRFVEADLERSDCRVDFNACVAGVGLSTFGKYIPGKIWMVVGKAAYLAKKNEYSLGRLSIISLSVPVRNISTCLFSVVRMQVSQLALRARIRRSGPRF